MRRTPLIALPCLLAALPALAFQQVEVKAPGALAGVQQVHVAPAAVELPEAKRFDRRGDSPRPVLERDAEARAADLVAALRRGFERNFTVVDAPGPGVLVVQPTLTRLDASRPTMADYQREPGLSFESVYAGGAAVRFRLERDGQEVAVLEDRYMGSFSDGAPRIGVWQDADRAFSMWSRQLPRWVEQPKTVRR
jgi:hypothetical protein